MNTIDIAERVKKLPPYLFEKIDRIKSEEIRKGHKLIALGIGDPDLPTPDFVLDRMFSAIKNSANHQYPSYRGMEQFRIASAEWIKKRFAVKVDSHKEVLSLIGTKEGIAHTPLALINPGEGALIPNPGYPVYKTSVEFAGGIPLEFDLLEKNDFLPDFAQLEKLIHSVKKVKLIFLNYPNNPTSACATLDFYKELVQLSKKHNLIVCHDNAYSEIFFGQKKQPSFLEAPGAIDVGCEFHSLSKTFNMTGWRVGFVIGNETIIKALGDIKSNIDSGIFNACQEAGIAALENFEPFCSELRAIYERRLNVIFPALEGVGLKCKRPEATFYLWSKLNEPISSEEFVLRQIKDKGLVFTPGSGFGTAGEGYVRMTLCADEKILKQVAEMLSGSVK